MNCIKGFILDVEHEQENRLTLWVKTEEGLRKVSAEHDPYFYVKRDGVSKKELESIEGVVKVEEAEKKYYGKKVRLWKVFTKEPGDVIHAREKIKTEAETFEARMRFINRFLADKELYASNYYNFRIKQGMLEAAEKTVQEPLSLKQLAFDIETYNPEGVSDPSRDPVLMIGMADENSSKVLTWGNGKKEEQMFKEFVRAVQEKDYDVLTGYNSNDFDIPYLKKRAKKLKIKLAIGRDGTEPGVSKSGLGRKSRINGRVHLDTYRGVSFLTSIGALRLPKNDLESIYKEFFGKEKLDIDCARIHEYWDKGGKDLELLKEYNRQDALAAYRLGEEILPLYAELSRILGLPLYDVTWMTSSQMVEWLVIREAVKRNELIPNIPKEREVIARMRNPIKGAFVKLPEKGLHEKIVVCDFRSLYPSIIMSFNIDSHTLVREKTECRECYETPVGHRFRKSPPGLIPTVLKELVYTRKKVKQEMKKTDKGSDRYKMLHFKQWGLKIIANACYGYMGYPRARFYSRECAESVTALGRKYIQETIQKAEDEGYKVLYADSVTADRFLTILDPNGIIQIKNVQELFEEHAEKAVKIGGKERIKLEGYRALTLDPKTREPCFKRIKEIIRHKTNKKIYRVNQKLGETRVTEDHSIMTEQKGKIIKARPEEMAEKKMIRINRVPKVKTLRRIDLLEWIGDYTQKTVYKGKEKTRTVQTDGTHVWFSWTKRKNPVKLKRRIEVGSHEFTALCRLLALYVAEGSSSTIETSKKQGASIALSDRKVLEQARKDYLTLFSNVKPSIIPSDSRSKRVLSYSNKRIGYKDKTLKLQMRNMLSAVFFRQLCGQKSHKKKIPEFIFHAPRKYQEIFLNQLILGDGSRKVNSKLRYSEEYKKKFFRYETKSLQLAGGMSLLLTQLGINYTVRYRPEKGTYSFTVSGKHNKKLNAKVTEEDYSGYVYDLAVEDTHTFTDSCGQILLHNTDSLFLKLGSRTVDDAKDFIKKVNKELPPDMELEYQGYYPRGLFVTKRGEKQAAKKKYALIRDDGTVEIKGFELVRRDWARIARKTQERVIAEVLEHGNPEKAAEHVQKVIQDLKEGKVHLDDLVIYTQLTRRLKDYEQIGPHVKAAEKLARAGYKIKPGMVLEYVITRGGGSISDRAWPIQLVGNRKPDTEYYIHHQILPASMKILAELGVKEDELLKKGKQTGLSKWTK